MLYKPFFGGGGTFQQMCLKILKLFNDLFFSVSVGGGLLLPVYVIALFQTQSQLTDSEPQCDCNSKQSNITGHQHR